MIDGEDSHGIMGFFSQFVDNQPITLENFSQADDFQASSLADPE